MSERIIKKIPGVVTSSRKDSQGYIDGLENKTMIELEDILLRQNKLLANKSFILKLPDRGEKILKFRDKVQNELAHRDEMEKASRLLSRLNIVSEGKNAINDLEWTGKYDEKSTQIVELDVDDELEPLKILAQPTGAGVHKKKIINLQPEESFITPEDLTDIESFKNEPAVLEHVKYIIDKVEKSDNGATNKKQLFKPYKTTLTDVHDPMKEKLRKKHNRWEVTAATPPLIMHGASQMLSLDESLKLQENYFKKLKEIETKHAIEQLTRHMDEYNIGEIPINVGPYRATDQISNDSNSEHEEDEVYDDDGEDDKAGTVVFSVDK
ncbi:hypothetical protein PV327_002519 [Microctonus hyperodae]|uniref:DNA-directed RNA polymerase II subunit GRINL1A n=1 Tax=Microctonus hyperodae TaxID=165561 RepID=A0AA39FFR7_MICHY|nr:hypothetical protein PV327_002519 [Microctonus hyperodae]